MQSSRSAYYGSRVRPNSDGKKPPLYFKLGSRPCQHKAYHCPLNSLEDYNYCPNHILADSTAPFQRCSYLYAYSSKRCGKAAIRSEFGAETYCPDHMRRMQRSGRRGTSTRPPPTAPTLLTSLAHHIQPRVVATDVNRALTAASLEYCSESESDVDSAVLATTVACCDEDWSDSESVDSSEDPFKMASVMTEEEGVERAKEKTLRLQALYKDQLTRLQHLLRERRRDYLQNIQTEKETLCSIAEQCASSKSPRDLKTVNKIAAYNRYKRATGQAALLRRKMKQKRLGQVGDGPGRHSSKCIFTESNVKCNAKTVPALKYCLKHVLNDPFQQLFRPCSKTTCTTLDPCQEALTVLEPCTYHMEMVPPRIIYSANISSSDEEQNSSANITYQREPESEEGEIKMEVATHDCDQQFVLTEMDYGQEVVVTDDL